MVVEGVRRRKSVRDTDAGDRIRQQLRELKALLAAYRAGEIREKE